MTAPTRVRGARFVGGPSLDRAALARAPEYASVGERALDLDRGQGASPGPARLVARGLSKAYGDQVVLAGLDLELAPATLVAVAGRNGAGKSTLLACLADTIRHRGRATLDGRPIGRATRGRVAYLPQRLRMPASATGREVLRLFAGLAADGRDRVPLPDGFLPDLDKPVGRLSGGQAQRIALAAVLRGAPDLVLLDEPFANLDDAARQQAHGILRAHRDSGATVLVASPTAIDLLAMIDRVLVIEGGAIAFDGAPSGYAGRLEVTVWVQQVDLPIDRLLALPHVLRGRAEGDWFALACHEERAVGLLRDLDALGVTADRVRIGGPAGDAGGSTSPWPGHAGDSR
jgi:ABC-type multidrug transport system ATPase subunit